MIKIAICDDEDYQLNKIYNLVIDLSKKHNIFIDIHTFSSSKNLMNFLYDNFNFFDLFFLDIVMDGTNGLELGKFIRDNNKLCEIVFTTTSKEYILDGYDIDASNYLLKPLDILKFEKQLLKSVDIIKKNSDECIIVKTNSNLIKVPLSNIVSFESKLRKVIVTTFNHEFIDFYEKLESINEKLESKNFIRCHKSYIVNLRYIKEINGNNILTTIDTSIPISRSYLKTTKDAFMYYFMENI